MVDNAPVINTVVTPKSWLDGFSKDTILSLYEVLNKAYKSASRLEKYEYHKYLGQAKIDYTFTTELFTMFCETYERL